MMRLQAMQEKMMIHPQGLLYAGTARMMGFTTLQCGQRFISSDFLSCSSRLGVTSSFNDMAHPTLRATFHLRDNSQPRERVHESQRDTQAGEDLFSADT